MSNVVVLLAAGSGSRMRGHVQDKVMTPLRGLPVLLHSMRAFMESGTVDSLVIVHREAAQRSSIMGAMANHGLGRVPVLWAPGGPERRDSVLNGLEACPTGTRLVFIHDGARPLVHPDALKLLAGAADRTGAAVLATRVKDTIKRAPTVVIPGEAYPLQDMSREGLWAMETPQVFDYALILNAYRSVVAERLPVTDDVAAATHAGAPVALVENSRPNPKITEPADLAWCEFLLSRERA